MSDDFRELMVRVRSGCEEARRDLLRLCDRPIARAIRKSLDHKLRSVYDTQDFAQAVWKTFYARLDDLDDFDGPGPLINYLKCIASSKIIDQHRRRQNVDRPPQPLDGEGSALAKGPTPSEEAIANEHWRKMIEKESTMTRQIAEEYRQGSKRQQIADKYGISLARVRRIVERIRNRYRRDE